MKHIFLTGEIGVGKSTLLGRVLALLGRPVCGFYTKKEAPDADGTSRTYIHSAGQTRHYGADNCVGVSDGVTKTGNVEVFDTLGVALLTDIPAGTLVVMDELGVMESRAPSFCRAVLDTLDQAERVVGVIKPKRSPLLDAIRAREDVAVFEVTPETREIVFEKIKRLLEAEYEKTVVGN